VDQRADGCVRFVHVGICWHWPGRSGGIQHPRRLHVFGFPITALTAMPSRCSASLLAVAALSAGLIGGAPRPASAQDVATASRAAQRAFFENGRALCGQPFGGRTILAEAADTTFEPARLYFVMEQCGTDELRMPFIVGDDDSRTWILRLGDDGLTFTHQHLREDGSEYDNSGFGGHASNDGSASFQSFPDFRATDATPAAERRVWRLRIDREHDLFVYYLDRGGRPAYRLVFHLGAPSPALRR
jgi:hypothetical protein